MWTLTSSFLIYAAAEQQGSPVSRPAQPTARLPPQAPTRSASSACGQLGVRGQNRSAGASSPDCPGPQCHRRGHEAGTDGGRQPRGRPGRGPTRQPDHTATTHSPLHTAVTAQPPPVGAEGPVQGDRPCRPLRAGSCVRRLGRGLWMNRPNASEHTRPPAGSQPLGPEPPVSQAALRTSREPPECGSKH